MNSKKRKQVTSVTAYTGVVSLEHKKVDPNATLTVYEQLKQARIAQAQQRESSALYARFDTLREAVEYNGTEHQHRMPIFAHNHPNSDSNYFVVASYDAVWRAMTGSRGLRNAHFYEQLRPIDPCHGFIDVEIYREPNAHRAKSELESGIHVRAMHEMRTLARQLNYIQQDDEMQFVVSESSNAEKVSLHFHVLTRHARFKNLYHFGAFMRLFARYTQQTYGTDPSSNPFFFRADTASDSAYEFWADMAVYTLNRNFRMLYNTKTSAYRPLLPVDVTQVDRVPPRLPQSTDDLDKSVWLRSILQRINVAEIELGAGFRLLTCADPLTGDEPTSTSKKYNFRLDGPQAAASGLQKNTTTTTRQLSSTTTTPRTFTTANAPPVLATLADAIGRYWSTLSNQSAASCAIALHHWNMTDGVAVFSSRSHYCALKRDIHKHNHVRFSMNMRHLRLLQTCFDNGTTCAGRTHLVPLHEVASSELLEQLRPFAQNTLQLVAATADLRQEAIELIGALDM